MICPVCDNKMATAYDVDHNPNGYLCISKGCVMNVDYFYPTIIDYIRSLLDQNRQLAKNLQIAEMALEIAFNEGVQHCREACMGRYNDVFYTTDDWKHQARKELEAT